MLAGGTGVTVVKIGTMGPVVVVVGMFARGSGRGWFLVGTAIVLAIGMLRLSDDGVLDDFNQRLGIDGATCKRLGINSDSLGEVCVMSGVRTVLQVACGEGHKLLLQCCKVGLVLK